MSCNCDWLEGHHPVWRDRLGLILGTIDREVSSAVIRGGKGEVPMGIAEGEHPHPANVDGLWK